MEGGAAYQSDALVSGLLFLEVMSAELEIDMTKRQSSFALMRAVNLTIDEKTWQAARRLAAERDTSVSGLVREALQNLTKTDERRERARKEILAMIGSFGGGVGKMPTREARNARR
jgi:hypothetical protein